MAEINKDKNSKEIDIDINDISNGEDVIIKSKKVPSTKNVKTSSKNLNTFNSQNMNYKTKENSSQKLDISSKNDQKKAEELFKDKDEKNETTKDDENTIQKKGENKKSSNGSKLTNKENVNAQINSSSGKIPKGNTPSKIPHNAIGKSGNPLGQGLKKGINGIGNATKEGAKKAAQQAGKAVAAAAKKAAAAIAKVVVSNPYSLLIIAIVIVILVVGILLYQLFNKDAATKDIEATVKNVDNLSQAINSGEIEGNVDQVNEALELNKNYGSFLGYTNKQLEYLYEKSIDTTGVNKDSTRYSLINLYKEKYGSGSQADDGVLRVSDYRELYKHILNTEKYNFNEINWINYGHDQDESRTLSKDDMNIDKELGIQYPKDSAMTSQKFMDLASPYLMSNYVPLSFLIADVTKSQSAAFKTGLTSNQETLKELGITNESGYKNENSLAYQILKYGMSDITISQYQLKHYLLDTYYLDYDSTDFHEEFSVNEKKTYSYTIYSNGLQSPTINTDTQYTYNNDLVTKQGETVHKNSRWNENNQEDVKMETVISEYPKYENIYYVTYAKCFDVEKNATYDYSKYNDSDVVNRTNADSESIVDSEYNETLNEDKKIVSVNINSSKDLDSYGSRNLINKTDSQPQRTVNKDGSITVTYTENKVYSIVGENYTVNKGKRYDIDRQWDDEVTAGSSDSKSLTADKVTEFNKNSENDEDKSTIDEATFQGSNDYKYYEELATNKKLNLVDILDSNPKVYQNYISSGSSQSEYIGLGREYVSTKTVYESIIKQYFDHIADGNKLKFVWGSSLGYSVASGESGSGEAGYGSAYNLMLQLLHEFEGGGTVYQNSAGEDCYKVLNVVGNMTVGYGIDITVNPQWKSQLEEQMGSSITFGTLVPCKYVDAIEKDFINRKLESIDAICNNNGIDLKEYQKHALLIRMYNTGNLEGFASAYKSFYKEDVDDRYETTYEKYKDQPENVSAITSCADLNSALFTNKLSKPVTSNGQTLSGLVTRRKEEYYLFSLGYYTHNKLHAFYTEGLSFNGIQAVKSDGSIDLDACYQLQAALEDSVFDGKFHSTAPGMNRPWGQKYSPNTKANTDDHGYLSDNYKAFFETSLYYQCPWWSRGRANIYLNSVDSTKFSGKFIRDGLGDGKNLAQGIANAYKVPFYTDLSQLTANCVISYGAGSQYGHTAYVEAVGNDYYVISHCGSGVAWHGVSIVPKTVNGLGSSYGFVGFVKMDDIVSKYGK